VSRSSPAAADAEKAKKPSVTVFAKTTKYVKHQSESSQSQAAGTASTENGVKYLKSHMIALQQSLQ